MKVEGFSKGRFRNTEFVSLGNEVVSIQHTSVLLRNCIGGILSWFCL